METMGSTDYSQQIEKQKNVQEELEGDTIELAGLKPTKNQVTDFVDGLTNAITAATSLKAAWQTLDADLEELITTWLLDEPRQTGLASCSRPGQDAAT